MLSRFAEQLGATLLLSVIGADTYADSIGNEQNDEQQILPKMGIHCFLSTSVNIDISGWALVSKMASIRGRARSVQNANTP